MKKIKTLAALIVVALTLTSCGITYYSYYEVESPEDATVCSLQDAYWSKSGESPTRCVAAYPDSTGHTVYLMETVIKERNIKEE